MSGTFPDAGMIWDMTDPFKHRSILFFGSNKTPITHRHRHLRKFIAVFAKVAFSPVPEAKISNQNLAE